MMPSEDRLSMAERQLRDHLVVLLGGRAAELPGDDTVITGLTADQIGALLKSMGIEFTQKKDDSGDDLFMMTLSDIKAQLLSIEQGRI